MNEYIYFLTIDDPKVNAHPSKKDLFKAAGLVRDKYELAPIVPYPVHCFEWKYTKKYGKRLHYHQLVRSKKFFIDYNDVELAGWSVKLEKLKTFYDVARVAGYIQKFKVDKVDIDEQPKLSPFKKDNKKNDKIIKANPFTMYLNIK